MANSKNRYALVDYLKAVCVFFVIITHSDFLNEAIMDKGGLFYLLMVNKAVPVFMFLSGFVYSLGAKGGLKNQYRAKTITRKLLRLTIPTIVTILLFVVLNFFKTGSTTVGEMVYRIAIFNFGQGSYYYPVMVQFVLLAPVMWHLVHKYKEKGVMLIGVINLFYEILWTLLSPSYDIFRILVFRYLFVIAIGMYAGINKDCKHNWKNVGLSAVVGLVYILLPYFTEYEYKIFTVDPWNKSGMMSGFYVASVMAVCFALWGKVKTKGKISNAISMVGKASYHIMYTQMIYFVVRPAFDTLIFDITALPLILQIIIDIVVSVVTGVVFCVLDDKFFGKLYREKA